MGSEGLVQRVELVSQSAQKYFSKVVLKLLPKVAWESLSFVATNLRTLFMTELECSSSLCWIHLSDQMFLCPSDLKEIVTYIEVHIYTNIAFNQSHCFLSDPTLLTNPTPC